MWYAIIFSFHNTSFKIDISLTLPGSNSGFSQINGVKPTADLPAGAQCQDCTCEASDGECSWEKLGVALKECGQWFECGSVYWSEEDSKYFAKGREKLGITATQNAKDKAWIKDKGKFSNFKATICHYTCLIFCRFHWKHP